MRIGIDGRALKEKKSGVGFYVYEILKYLNENDVDNQYYIYSDKKIYLDFKLNNNFHICDNLNESNKIGTLWYYYAMPKTLYKDGINVFWGTFHFLPKRNKYTKNIKYILTVHDIALLIIKNTSEFVNVLMHKLLFKKSCIDADKIMVISESTKKDLIEHFNINKDKIKVIYLAPSVGVSKMGITKKDSDEIKKKYNLDDSEFLFFLSTIEPRKNVVTLVKAFEVLKQNNKNLKLVIAGGLGWKYNNVLKTVNESKYKKDIIMPGYITSLEKNFFYENAICFVFPSLYEGFGLPVLEAMTNKQIVVTSNVSSLPEVGGEAAFYYDEVLNYNNLAMKIKEIINLDKTDRDARINMGLKHANKFSWEKTANEVKKIITKKE